MNAGEAHIKIQSIQNFSIYTTEDLQFNVVFSICSFPSFFLCLSDWFQWIFLCVCVKPNVIFQTQIICQYNEWTKFWWAKSNKHDNSYRMQFSPKFQLDFKWVLCVCVCDAYTFGNCENFWHFIQVAFAFFNSALPHFQFSEMLVCYLQSTRRYILIHLIKAKMQTTFRMLSNMFV